VPLCSFPLNDYTLGFHPKPQNLEPHWIAYRNKQQKHCSVAFIRMVTLKDFIQRLETLNHLVQHNKQYHRKVLLDSFHSSGHTSGFHPQTSIFGLVEKEEFFPKSTAIISIKNKGDSP